MAKTLRKRKARFYNHISAKKVRAYWGDQVWDSYTKFCFERDPCDRIVSLYYWRCKSNPQLTIPEFIGSAVPLVLKRRGFELYSIDGQIAVDKTCRFETLSEELEVVLKQFGISEKLELPRAKSRFKKGKRSYRDIPDEEDKVKIAELFCDEISLLGYGF